MDHRKAERVTLSKWYLGLPEFRPIRDWKLKICSAQEQNSVVTSIVKIPYFLNHLEDRVI
jgi:hypothetical protein